MRLEGQDGEEGTYWDHGIVVFKLLVGVDTPLTPTPCSADEPSYMKQKMKEEALIIAVDTPKLPFPPPRSRPSADQSLGYP